MLCCSEACRLYPSIGYPVTSVHPEFYEVFHIRKHSQIGFNIPYHHMKSSLSPPIPIPRDDPRTGCTCGWICMLSITVYVTDTNGKAGKVGNQRSLHKFLPRMSDVHARHLFFLYVNTIHRCCNV